MKVVTFFSFKGGVGRSTALANVAYLLADAGYRVACTDFDIEAPGLHFVFDIAPGALRGWLQEYLVEPTRFRQPHQFSSLFVDVRDQRHYSFGTPRGELKLLAAGIRPDLNDRIHVNIDMFKTVQQFYDAVENYLAPDILLVDSRSGMSSLALPAQMRSDAIVLLFRLGRQQLIGTENTVEWLNRRFRANRDENVPMLLVCSNVPEEARTDSHQREMLGLATDLERQTSNDRVSFVTTVFSSSLLSSGERIVVDQPHLDSSLYTSYRQIASSIREAVELEAV